jgi:prepilin-type N-terminal cleavage/methylation domain-containing protein
MKRAFTLIELLVVVAIISLLVALGLPVMTRVREQGGETVCRSNLRQMAMAVKTYGNNNDNVFPDPSYIYHSPLSFWPRHDEWRGYWTCCRWHDARIGLESDLLRNARPELRGSLWSYLGDPEIVRCRVGQRANKERGCSNACILCVHDPRIDIVPQYSYSMNTYLGTGISTGRFMEEDITKRVDSRTIRGAAVRKETQVTRSPSEVFVFGEENSWAINTEGRQPIGVKSAWAAQYELSGKYYLEMNKWHHGTLGLPSLDILSTYLLRHDALEKEDRNLGDAFATCHRPHKGDLNAGHSYVSMLDGHVRKVTVSDQLRRSRRVPYLEESRLGPGGNLALAWPVDIPPPGGWENQ